MKNFSRHINLMKDKFVKRALMILLAISLAFSCFMPSAKAFADTKNSSAAKQTTQTDTGGKGPQIIPDIKSPFANPIQTLINQLYNKILGPVKKEADESLSKVLDWILGNEPGSTAKSQDEKIGEIQKSISHLDQTVKWCHDETMQTLRDMMTQTSINNVTAALKPAKILFDDRIKSHQISTINHNLGEYSKAKATDNKEQMLNALKNIAYVDGIYTAIGEPISHLEATYQGLYGLSITFGGDSDLKNLYDKLLKSKKDADKVTSSYFSYYYPFMQYMNKINDYQVISLTALREHELTCDAKDKILPSISDKALAEKITNLKNRTPKVMTELESLNNQISNLPNLVVTFIYNNDKSESVRYHSFADAWVDAQLSNATSVKITLYSDFVYNGEDKNYYGDAIAYDNRNMRSDLTKTQYGPDSNGFFRDGNLLVKSGKNIQLDLNSHTLANLVSNQHTITVQGGASLNLINPFEDGQHIKGQIGSINYENGSAGLVYNVKFSDKYNFQKYEITNQPPKASSSNMMDNTLKSALGSPANDSVANNKYKYEYKEFNNVSGQPRILACVYNAGGTKDFEVSSCDFNNVANTSQGRGSAIEIYGKDNFIKTNAGKEIDTRAGAEISDCTFKNCSANTGGAISTTKHINVAGCVFDGCSSKSSGGAIHKLQIEGDYEKMKHPEKTYDSQASTFTNCQFKNNSSGERGGAINILGDAKIDNTTFTNNTAAMGGAIYGDVRRSLMSWSPSCGWEISHYGTIDLTNSSFNNNQANKTSNIENDGGAVALYGSKIVTRNTNFTNNSANKYGGAVYHIAHPHFENFYSDYNGVTITNNSAGACGGGIYNDTNSMTLKNITVTNNTCTSQRGAGVLAKHEVFLHENVIVKENHLATGEKSNFRIEALKGQCIFPANGFYQGGSDLHLDLKGTSNIITDKKTVTSNKDWLDRINAAKQYMHMDDGRTVQVDTWGTWFWQKYWLKAA